MIERTDKGIFERYYAMVWLGISSIATVGAGMVSSKIAAELIGVPGVGLMALVLTSASLLSTLVLFGAGQTLVREVGNAEARGDSATVRRFIDSSRLLVVAMAGVVTVAAAVAGPRLSVPLFGHGARSWWPLGTALAAGAYSWAQLQLSTLVAFHRVKLVSGAAVATAFVSPLTNLVMFKRIGINGVVPGAMVANWIIAVVLTVLVSYAVPIPARQQSSRVAAMPTILREGRSLVPVSLLGTAATFVAFFGIRLVASIDEVGQARAAMTIALSYIVAVNAATTRDFFPRLSRAVDDRIEFGKLSDYQIRLVVLTTGPLVALLAAALPTVVRIAFSAEFLPAVDVLRWQMVGDIVRLVSVVIATVVLVGLGAQRRLLPELIGSVSLSGFTVVGAYLGGLAGIGVGYLASYAVYLSALSWVARDLYRMRRSTARLFVAVLSLLLCSVILGFLLESEVAFWLRWSVALALSAYSLVEFRLGEREHADPPEMCYE